MKSRSVRALFFEVWQLLDRSQRRRFLRLQGLCVLMAFSTLLGVTSVLPFLGVFADPSLIERNRLLTLLYAQLGFASPAQFVTFLGISFVLLVCVANAVNLAGQVGIRRFAHEVGATLQTALFTEYLHRDCLFHARHEGAALASRVVYPVDMLAIGILQNLLVLGASAASCALIFTAVLFVNPPAALISIALFGGCYAVIYVVTRRRLLANGRTQARRWNERARLLAGSFGAIKEVLLSGTQRHFRDLLARQSHSIARTAADTLSVAQLPRQVIECVAAAAIVGAAFWLGRGGESRWFAEITFLALAAYRLLPALQQGFAALAHIGADRGAFENIAEDLRAALVPRAEAARAVPDASWRGKPGREISVREISFRYAPHLPLAIRDVSLRIPAGARVGLVGPNGSGKSTLADLIVGLLSPETGEITVDGVRLSADALPAWQGGIAYVPQTVFLQNASVAENIAFGLKRDAIDVERVCAAARQAQLTQFIESLPGGYAEMLGERGVRVSGGQRQLIGIARALYREAPVLVLDEATNALDADNERRVIAALCDGPPRTIIVIAHHAAALRECDLLFELDAGELVATGSPRGRVLRTHGTLPLQESQP